MTTNDSPAETTELFAGDEPYSYASVLANLLSELRRLAQSESTEYVTDVLSNDEDPPEFGLEVLNLLQESLTSEVEMGHTDEYIVYDFSRGADKSDSVSLADHVTVHIEYYPTGELYVETRYTDNPNAESKSMYWQGWLAEYDEFESYKMGALVAMRLLGQYTDAGLSAAQALDLGATAGIGYSDYFSWSNQRNVGYEAIRKNATHGGSVLRDLDWDARLVERDVFVARCGDCGRNMQTADSCDRKRVGVFVDVDGTQYKRHPYGNEDTLTIEYMEEMGVDDEQIQKYKETVQRNPIEDGDRCPDCNVLTGGIHHSNCDKEICPKCKGQLLSCDCQFRH